MVLSKLRSKRRGGYRKRRGGMRKRMGIRKPLALRKKFSGVKYFTETFQAGYLTPSGGGIFISALNSMINSTQYFNLFDLGTITRFDVMLVPMGGDVIQGVGTQTGRITWCATTNPDAATPGTELTLLQHPDCKTAPLDGKRIIKLKCYRPKPQITNGSAFGNVLAVGKSNSWTWLDLNQTSGRSLPFIGIPFYVTNPAPNPVETYEVLIKVYAAFKEQD